MIRHLRKCYWKELEPEERRGYEFEEVLSVALTRVFWTVVRNARMPLVLLLGAVGFVLLIATANLANLCLARAVSRQNEFAIRMALGAGRLRIARQLVGESVLLSCMGGAAGLLFARWSISLLIGLIPASFPRTDEITLDGRVLGFTFAISLVVGLLFALAPILTIWRNDVNGSLKPETRGSTGNTGGRRLRASLVISQVAFVMVLLTGTGLLIRSFQRLNEVDPGFRPEHLVAVDVSIGDPGRIQLVEQLLARLSDLPGIESLAAVDGLPLDAGRGNMDIALTSIEGSPPTTPDEKLVTGLRLVSPGYFQTIGSCLLRGRLFTARDNTNGPPVVIVNQALAQRCFPGSDPVGKRIGSPDFGPQPCQIVGVINDVKQGSLDAISKPEVFRPLLQECFSGITIVARSSSAPAHVFARVREALTGGDRKWPAYNLRTLDQLISASLGPRRFALLLMELYAGVALLLALVGIYGVLSCVVNERTREIGIRLALGAQRCEVLAMILIRGMRSVAVGGLIGLAGACALTRFLRSLLYGVSPTDPVTFVAVALLLSLVALVACWLPAWRATKVDPMEALRCE